MRSSASEVLKMDLGYVDILTRVASQAYMNLIYCSVCSSSSKGRGEVKGMYRGYRYLRQMRVSLY